MRAGRAQAGMILRGPGDTPIAQKNASFADRRGGGGRGVHVTFF